VDILKSMNVVSIAFGVESGSASVLKYLKGSGVTVEQNARAVELANRNGLIAFGYLILGAPGETKEEARKTLRFARDHLGEMFHWSLLTPLPGTPIWDLALRAGIVSEDMDWGRLKANYDWDIDNAVLVNDAMTRDDLRELHDEFLRLQKRRIAKRVARDALRRPGEFANRWLAHPAQAARAVKAHLSRSKQAY
jgi:radical SAM superfamily enzyme YgiQ (UPF0313 family)